MSGIENYIFALGMLCVVAALPGCATTETTSTTHASSAATASAESVAVSVSTETTTVSRQSTQPPATASAVDILSDMKKPCGAIAADAPKFVEPEATK